LRVETGGTDDSLSLNISSLRGKTGGGSRKAEARDQKPEARRQKPEARRQRPESRKPEGRKTEARGRKAEGGHPQIMQIYADFGGTNIRDAWLASA